MEIRSSYHVSLYMCSIFAIVRTSFVSRNENNVVQFATYDGQSNSRVMVYVAKIQVASH